MVVLCHVVVAVVVVVAVMRTKWHTSSSRLNKHGGRSSKRGKCTYTCRQANRCPPMSQWHVSHATKHPLHLYTHTNKLR